MQSESTASKSYELNPGRMTYHQAQRTPPPMTGPWGPAAAGSGSAHNTTQRAPHSRGMQGRGPTGAASCGGRGPRQGHGEVVRGQRHLPFPRSPEKQSEPRPPAGHTKDMGTAYGLDWLTLTSTPRHPPTAQPPPLEGGGGGRRDGGVRPAASGHWRGLLPPASDSHALQASCHTPPPHPLFRSPSCVCFTLRGAVHQQSTASRLQVPCRTRAPFQTPFPSAPRPPLHRHLQSRKWAIVAPELRRAGHPLVPLISRSRPP